MAQHFTVDQLLKRGLTAFWKCMACEASGDVDLSRVARERGPDTTLMNRHPPCRRCDGRVFFYVRGGLAVQRQTTAEAELAALRSSAQETARVLYSKGYRRVRGVWVAPRAPR